MLSGRTTRARALRAVLWTPALAACAGELSVAPPAPVADAGFDQVRFLRGDERVTVELDGRASCDPLGEAPLEVSWRIVAAPSGARPQVSGEGLRTSLDVDRPGEYLVALTVKAGMRASETDYVTIRVESGDGDDVVVVPPSTNVCGEPL